MSGKQLWFLDVLNYHCVCNSIHGTQIGQIFNMTKKKTGLKGSKKKSSPRSRSSSLKKSLSRKKPSTLKHSTKTISGTLKKSKRSNKNHRDEYNAPYTSSSSEEDDNYIRRERRARRKLKKKRRSRSRSKGPLHYVSRCIRNYKGRNSATNSTGSSSLFRNNKSYD